MLNPQEILGKPVKERYGRFTGTIVSYESNLLGEITAIVYESNGVLIRTEASSFIYNGSEVEIAPNVIIESTRLHEDLTNLRVRLESLFKLKRNGLMSENAFNRIKGELDSIYSALKEKAANLIERLEDRESRLVERREWLYGLFMNLEISRRLNWITPEEYMNSYEHLEKELFRISNELDDVRRLRLDLNSSLESVDEIISSEGGVEREEKLEVKESREVPV